MKKYIDTIMDYNYWANRRILARAAGLTQEQLDEKAPYMWDSIMGTMAHVLGAEWIWRQRIHEGVSPTAILDRNLFTTLESLNQRWDEEERLMRGYLAGLKDADLERVVESKNTRGVTMQRPLWHILIHIVNHGTQHRSEVALSLTNFDCSPGDMDITVYLIAAGL